MSEPLVLIDDPAPGVRRLTLNRPDKRNPLSNALRTELFAALEAADVDDSVRVTIIRGAGSCFSAGYDLKSNVAQGATRPAAWATGPVMGWRVVSVYGIWPSR